MLTDADLGKLANFRGWKEDASNRVRTGLSNDVGLQLTVDDYRLILSNALSQVGQKGPSNELLFDMSQFLVRCYHCS